MRGESFCSTLVEVVARFVQGRLQKLTEVLPESELVFRKGMFQKNIHHSLIDQQEHRVGIFPHVHQPEKHVHIRAPLNITEGRVSGAKLHVVVGNPIFNDRADTEYTMKVTIYLDSTLP